MKQSFHSAHEPLLVGFSWYPEMWPEEEWARDIERMRAVGIRLVRVFEFAWHRCEPHEGEYDFEWAHRVLDLLHAAGLRVMIGTPTAAPPAWLTSHYPEVLQTRPDGTRASHGQRKHYSHHSTKYRELAAGIATRFAAEFATHPALYAWQIDNEMSGADFSAETRADFARWLEHRFGTVEAMNRAWGLEFWSQAYERFDQVPMPTSAVGSIEVPERDHPSLLMAVATHRNEAWTDFIRMQAEAIRAFSDKPITTNMTPGFGMDWYAHNRVLDRVGVSLYRDVLHYEWNIEFYDRMRAEKDAPFWLLETAPNWSATGRAWNIHHDASGLMAMAWQSFLCGGSLAVFCQWREHWAGQEMQHGVLVSATGKWRPNRDAFTGLCADLQRVGPWLIAHPAPRARVALVQSNQAAWAFSIDPGDDDMGYEQRWREDFYLPLLHHHIWRDVISDLAPLDGYQLVIIPHLPVVPTPLRERLTDFVAAGGHVILGPYTGYRTEEFTAFRDRDFGGLEELFGAGSALRFTAHWVEDQVSVEFSDGLSSSIRSFAEAWELRGAEVVASYRGGYGDGLPAIVRHRHGKGVVTMVGCRLDAAARWRLTQQHLDELGIKPLATGDAGVLVAPRINAAGELAGLGLVNLRPETRHVTLPSSGTDLLTGEPCGAVVELPPLATRIVALIAL